MGHALDLYNGKSIIEKFSDIVLEQSREMYLFAMHGQNLIFGKGVSLVWTRKKLDVGQCTINFRK